MKILLLSDTYSEHTEKWALGLASQNIEVGIFSFNKATYNWHEHENITVFFEPEKKINADNLLTKISYIKYLSIIRKIIKHFKPDILHAHYATSYGLIGALSGFKPFFLSVWGSDVYDFPKKSKLHKKVFQHNLNKASVIMSTSKIMMQEVKKYTNKEIFVTPFGVDLTKFINRPTTIPKDNSIYIGTIKPIEEKYGIEYIIDAAQILLEKHKENFKYKFLLIGPGSNLEHYKEIIRQKNLEPYFEITGRIPFTNIVDYHNLLDIFLNVSIDDSESFGVAAVEAMACEKPVIVSDVGGLMEVVNNGEFGRIVKKKDSSALANAIDEIANNIAKEKEAGKLARKHVLKNYDWANNLNYMISIYKEFLNKNKK
ncbi:MAG: glycosyltransferase [Bacteroidota bacterium]|nr:glycosyltransferase [Bacteroidota bacterium]MDP3145208.1 glycosyltransferase [Bacteroidota bacterium]MDP3557267.1 glycosyltransferase [Bacteroidota bacterium]